VHRFRIARAAQETAVLAEGQTADRDAALDSPPELVQLHPVRHVEHPDHGPLLRGRGYPCSRVVEHERRQGAVVSSDHNFRVLQHKTATSN